MEEGGGDKVAGQPSSQLLTYKKRASRTDAKKGAFEKYRREKKESMEEGHGDKVAGDKGMVTAPSPEGDGDKVAGQASGQKTTSKRAVRPDAKKGGSEKERNGSTEDKVAGNKGMVTAPSPEGDDDKVSGQKTYKRAVRTGAKKGGSEKERKGSTEDKVAGNKGMVTAPSPEGDDDKVSGQKTYKRAVRTGAKKLDSEKERKGSTEEGRVRFQNDKVAGKKGMVTAPSPEGDDDKVSSQASGQLIERAGRTNATSPESEFEGETRKLKGAVPDQTRKLKGAVREDPITKEKKIPGEKVLELDPKVNSLEQCLHGFEVCWAVSDPECMPPVLDQMKSETCYSSINGVASIGYLTEKKKMEMKKKGKIRPVEDFIGSVQEVKDRLHYLAPNHAYKNSKFDRVKGFPNTIDSSLWYINSWGSFVDKKYKANEDQSTNPLGETPSFDTPAMKVTCREFSYLDKAHDTFSSDQLREVILEHPFIASITANKNSFEAWNGRGVYKESAKVRNSVDKVAKEMLESSTTKASKKADEIIVHSVLVVGYGFTSSGLFYYIFQNSWGNAWGYHGYGRIAENCIGAAGWPVDVEVIERTDRWHIHKETVLEQRLKGAKARREKPKTGKEFAKRYYRKSALLVDETEH